MKRMKIKALSQLEFRSAIKKSFILSLALTALSGLLYWIGMQQKLLDLKFLSIGLFVLGHFILSFKVSVCLFSGRVINCYPELSSKKFIGVEALAMVPLVFIIVCTYLWFKENSNKPAPFLFRNTKLVILGCFFAYIILPVSVMTYGSLMPTYSYWMTSPSVFYITKVYSETMKVFDLKAEAKSQKKFIRISDFKKGFGNGNVTSTAKILFMAVQASSIHDFRKAAKKTREIASDQENAETTGYFLKDFIELNSQANTSVGFFNPASFFNPSSAVEMGLLILIDEYVSAEANLKASESIEKMIIAYEKDSIEKGNEKIIKDAREIKKLLYTSTSYAWALSYKKSFVRNQIL